MNTIIIRLGEEKDLTTVTALADDLSISDFLYDSEVDQQWAHTPNGQTYFLEKLTGKNGVCIVAESDNHLVGYALIGFKTIPSYRLVKVADLENIFVRENFRSQGIGTKLLSFAISWAKEKGYHKLSVTVFAGNEKAITFYKHAGFQAYDMTLELLLLYQ